MTGDFSLQSYNSKSQSKMQHGDSQISAGANFVLFFFIFESFQKRDKPSFKSGFSFLSECFLPNNTDAMSLSSKVSRVNKGKRDLSDYLAFVSPPHSLSDSFCLPQCLSDSLCFSHTNAYTRHSCFLIPVLFIENVCSQRSSSSMLSIV